MKEEYDHKRVFAQTSRHHLRKNTNLHEIHTITISSSSYPVSLRNRRQLLLKVGSWAILIDQRPTQLIHVQEIKKKLLNFIEISLESEILQTRSCASEKEPFGATSDQLPTTYKAL